MGYEEIVAAEKSKRAELVERLEMVGREVAAGLGDGWTARVPDDAETRREGRTYVVHTDGRRIDLDIRLYDSPAKIDVSGRYNFGGSHLGIGYSSYSREMPRISVSLSRPGSAIAKDIQRRFLNDYTALYTRICETVAAYQAAWDRKSGVVDRLCTLGGFNRNGAHEWRGAVEGRVWTQGSGVVVDLKIDNLRESDAAAVIELVKTLRGARATDTTFLEELRAETIFDLLWDYLKRDPDHKDRRQTGWGTKTKVGLVACLDRIYEGRV